MLKVEIKSKSGKTPKFLIEIQNCFLIYRNIASSTTIKQEIRKKTNKFEIV